MKKILLLFIAFTTLLFGCSNTLVAEIATVKEVNNDFIIIENLSGEIKEIAISPTEDFRFEVNEEYFFNYEVTRSKKAVFISAEE